MPAGAPPPTGTNGFAIAALVCCILCFPLGIVFAIVALVQTKRTGQSGRGMAIAGLVIAGLWILGIVALGVIGYILEPQRNAHGEITKGGRISPNEVQLGDCLGDVPRTTGRFGLQSVVPCSDPHGGQVFARQDIAGTGAYPGEAEVQKRALAVCRFAAPSALQPEILRDPTVGVFFYYPLEPNWNAGDRTVSCIVTFDSKRTGSVRR